MMRTQTFAALLAYAGFTWSALAQPPCGDWLTVPTLDPGTTTNLLFDLAFAAPDNGLAVGIWSGGAPSRQPMIQHWNGSSWTSMPLPDVSHLGTMPSIEGAGVVGGDQWIVGYVTTPSPTNNMPLVAHRGDGRWEAIAAPTLRRQNTYPFAERGGFAHDVAGTGPGDIWVVGTANGYGDASSSSVGLALHFDGSGWQDVPVPIVGNRSNHLDSVSASAADNVWAVGDWRHVAGAYQALIVRWDGSSWQRIANPGEGASGGDAETVLALAHDDVWVAGSFNNGADHLIHWNGSSWDVVDAGIPGTFAAFAAVSPDDIWASCALNATIYHYDGTSWRPAGGTAIPGSQYILRGWGLQALGPCDVWSVGGWSDGAVQYTLAEHLSSSGCAADFNRDGGVDGQDVEAFFVAWEAADPRADFNQDGGVDGGDVEAFFLPWEAGC